MLGLERSFVWCWNMYTSEIRPEVSWKLWSVVLEKEGEDPLDPLREKWKSIRQGQGEKEHPK
jgi:hypothetical protein